ncbi:MAG: type II 3-dehydroquinate dehydratase [Flavobacteriaceae bacterium]|nr:type II 3-dehydroquinate dehydratase [Flavobacteriaceae bacterium]
MNNKIQIINGPNLNLLGKRETSIYGNQTFENYFEELQIRFPQLELYYFQSNHEGDLIDKIHDTGFRFKGIVLNAGALTHYSYALADAVRAIETPVVEVHISDIFQREDFRKVSLTAAHCVKMISGKGLEGYAEAIQIFL